MWRGSGTPGEGLYPFAAAASATIVSARNVDGDRDELAHARCHFEGISKADTLIADVTAMNFNVTFEILRAVDDTVIG